MTNDHRPSFHRIGIAAILSASALILSPAADAQTADELAETATSTEAVLQLQQDWIDAEVAGDVAALERLLDERFVAVMSSGRTVDRATYIQIIVDAKLEPFQVYTERVDLHGDTAVVIDLSEDGKTKFFWIAQKRDGVWRAIAESFPRVRTEQ